MTEPEMAIGGGRKAGTLMQQLQSTVDAAMAKASNQIGRATDVLVGEIEGGTKAVTAAILKDAAEVRQKFDEIVGNAAAVAEDAVANARASIEDKEEKPPGALPTPGAAPSSEGAPRPNGQELPA